MTKIKEKQITKEPIIPMATASLITLQSFGTRLSLTPSSNSQPIPTSLSPASFCSALRSAAFLKTKRWAQHLRRTSSEDHLATREEKWTKSNKRKATPQTIADQGVSGELIEDPKFVPLNADDPIYGPPALLLLGFEADETDKIKNFLKDLDGEFLKVIHCTEDMLTRSVWDAMHTEQPRLETVKIAKSLPRVCFLSGLSGEEMMMFIDAFPETGLKPAVFAALVPNSADKLLADVAEEIMGDHEMLSAKNST